MAKILRESITFKDAMDNLSALASIDPSAVGPIGILGKNRIVVDEEEFPQLEIRWLSAEGSEPLLEVLDSTFRAIYDYLLHLFESPEMDWDSERGRRAISAIIALAGESVTRLEKYLENLLGKSGSKISDREGYRSLIHLYERKFSGRVKDDEPHEVDDAQLKNMETVRRDQEYELFYILKEDGSPYFSPELLRHMRLICDVESEGDSFEEDPLLQVRSMVDRDLQASAKQILSSCHLIINDFYKIFRRLSNNDLAASLSFSITALFLSANPNNLLQNTSGKTSQQYFEDFHRFLRSAFRTDEYQKMIAYPPEKGDKVAHLLLNLIHGLSDELFHRKGGVKQEAIGLIHRTARKGSEEHKITLKKEMSIWNQLLVDDENYRSRLAKFPSGPLFKILDLIRMEEREPISFDSISQGNYPMHLFEIHVRGKGIDVLHIPSPTRQQHVNKVEILDEMRGMLRYYSTGGAPRKHLLINLQERTSWKEYARCKAVEELQKNAEFSNSLTVITIPKNTDFYTQNSEYLNVNTADEFMTAILQQLEMPEECGFYFPPSFKLNELVRFAESILPLIHRHFFQKKNVLTRRNREDFIEIFYQFVILKLIDQLQPDSISFTCKDAIDTGAAESACFFAFLKMFSSGFDEKIDLDYFRWLMYAPSLFVRERATDPERLTRALTALERIDMSFKENKKAMVEDFASLYHPQLFKSLQITG